MVTGVTNTVVEGFVLDNAFVDSTKTIHAVFLKTGHQIASLTPKALSYFNQPYVFEDSRTCNCRDLNWVSTTHPQILFDQLPFQAFVDTVNALPENQVQALFTIVDRILFKHQTSDTVASLESYFATIPEVMELYTPGHLSVSTLVSNGTVYTGTSPQIVAVPQSCTFAITLDSGQTTTTYILTLYASTDAFTLGYSHSTVIKVIPPLPYEKLYEASLIASVDNIFTTAKSVTDLAYSSQSTILNSQSASGMFEYTAIITDGTNSVPVPFNLLYKGRTPSLLEIRDAIKDALLSSGVGTQTGWMQRIPGVFVFGRFYLIPLWDETLLKVDQVVYPSIHPVNRLIRLTNKILASLGQVDVSQYTDVLDVYYNRLTVMAVPDLSGLVDIQPLSEIIDDYQNYAPSEDGFGYMSASTKLFSSTLNQVLAIDAGAGTSTTLTPSTENLLTFYSFTVDRYEMCVLTHDCVSQILEAAQ